MLWRVKEVHGPTSASLQGFLAIPMWMVALIISVACGNVNAVTRTSVTRQEIGIEERLQAEKRLWEFGYWAGPIDGTFDSASRHALVAFQKVEGRARTGNLTSTELKALQTATRPRARYEGFAHIDTNTNGGGGTTLHPSPTLAMLSRGWYVGHGRNGLDRLQ